MDREREKGKEYRERKRREEDQGGGPKQKRSVRSQGRWRFFFLDRENRRSSTQNSIVGLEMGAERSARTSCTGPGELGGARGREREIRGSQPGAARRAVQPPPPNPLSLLSFYDIVRIKLKLIGVSS